MKGKKTYTEKEIINGCARNERLFQEILYKQYFGKMMSICLRHTHDKENALLIVNDGFLKVFKNIEKYSFQGSFEGWIRKIVFRCISDYFRKESKHLKAIVFMEQDDIIEDTALSKLYFDELIDLVYELPIATSEVFLLYAIEGYKHREIGERLNISEGTSKWHLSNARKLLKEKLKKRKNIYYAG